MQVNNRLGTVDIHFTSTAVHGTLILERDLEEIELTKLIEQIDEDLVLSADMPRDVPESIIPPSRRRRHLAHVNEAPPMAVEVGKAVRIHESKVLRCVTRAASSDCFGDEVVDFRTALASKREQHLGSLARIADLFGREIAEPGVCQQHDKDRVADADA